ncbi:hypothetical protein RYX36_034430, partial [Vicia faba]
ERGKKTIRVNKKKQFSSEETLKFRGGEGGVIRKVMRLGAYTFHNNNFSSSYGYGYDYGYGSVLFSPQKKPQVFNNNNSNNPRDDVNVNLVFDVILRKKKRNTVIIDDTVVLTEGLVGELMERFERGEVPDEMKKAHFVKFHNLASVSSLKREESEMNVKKPQVFNNNSNNPRDDVNVNLVFDVLLRKKKRNTVIIGDIVALTEGLV